jgi:drug/metabolite transporter (DMT)-like permease
VTIPILLLVFASSVLHAGWNYLAKTVPSGLPFVWLCAIVMMSVLLPAVVGYAIIFGLEYTPAIIGALLVTGMLHLVYFLVLQKGYQSGDLSVVYPLARGSGPVFSTLGAVVLLGEQVTMVSLTGLIFVAAGVWLISGAGSADSGKEKRKIGFFYGITTGVLIACYTVWDGYAVKELAIAPIFLEFSSNPIRIVVLAPAAWRKWPEVKAIWRGHWQKIVAISCMAPLGFIFFLYAMKSAPIHLVAPIRELSIVIGVILGAKMLTEGSFRPRLIGALLILGGIVFLAQ